MLLQSTSQAIDNGSNPASLATDARGGIREAGPGGADIGAVELQQLAPPSTPQAFVVTTLNDELDFTGPDATIANMGGAGDLSLREALFLAGQDASTADTIAFHASLGGGVLRLTQGQLSITGDVSIDGDTDGDNRADIVITGDANGDDATTTDSFGNVITDAATNANTADNSRVFTISGAGTDASLSSLVVTGGVFGGGHGGGIRVRSNAALTLEHASVAGNSAFSGGGIANDSSVLTVRNSTIAGNIAANQGGGIFSNTNTGSQLTTIVNTTISGNSAKYGGGIFNLDGRTIVQNTTISGNNATTSGGGVSSWGDGVTFTDVESTIVAGNTAGTAAAADVGLYASLVNSFAGSPGNNLIGDGNGLFTNGVDGNIVGSTGALVDPLLGPLANNGGPVETMLLQSTSQAIDNGSNPASLATDARGVARNVDLNANPNNVDIGAVELQQLSPPMTPQAFVVTTLDDELDSAGADANIALMGGVGDLSLREALFLANQDAATADTIAFHASLGGGVLRLTQGQLTITGDISISGDTDGDNRADIVITGDANGDDVTTTDSFGNVITDAATNGNTADNSRVFAISGAGTDASLSSLVVTGGVVGGGNGGGIRVGSNAALTLEHASVAGNSANHGGGIANAFSVLTVRNSTIAGNIAANRGGGIFSDTNTTGSQLTTIVNTTISGNSALYGGGIFNFDGRTIVQNTTISGNNATTSGGGVSSWGDDVTFTDVESTIVAGNTAGTAAAADVALHFGVINSFANSPSNNLIGDGNGLFANGVDGNIVGSTGALVDPLLGALTNNGGPVETMALLTGSLAIDNGSNPAGLPGDARGVFREVGSGADIGAFETQGATPYADILIGSASGDTIDGLGGNDIITGLAGDDTIIGGLGVDNLDGGGNTAAGDTLAFADDGRGHTVDLAAGTSASNVTTLVNSGATTSTVLTDALAGNIYINVHSNAFPGGELRGQLSSVASDTTDALGVRTVVFLVDPLLGTSEVPPNASAASGSAQAILVDDAGAVTFSVDIALAGLPAANITNAHFHTGAPGVNGPAATSIFTGATIADVVQFDTIAGFENVTGGRGADEINGDGGANVLNGGDGNDIIVGGGGADTMNGGDGNDILFVDNVGDVVMEAVGEGTNDSVATNTNYTLTAGAEIELFTTTSTAGTTAINLTGNSFAQTIVGNAGNNVLSDGGGAGADILRGLGGNDVYIVRNAATTIDESAGQGANDRVAAAVDFALAADDDIELLTTTSTGGTAGIDLVGNALAQTIIGNAGSNVLRSGTGAPDILRGLGGNDVYRVFNAGDVIDETAGNGTNDRVVTVIDYALGAGVDIELFTTDASGGTSNLKLTGNELAQTIVGNSGDNILSDGGGAGADSLNGYFGNDTYIVRNAATTIDEVAGRGTNDRVAAGVDFALAADDDIELLTTTSTGSTAGIDLVGNALAQTIIGNAGSNILRSGTGAPDILRGLGGNDVYRVFNSGDVVDETTGNGTNDRVVTVVDYTLGAGVDIELFTTDASGGTSNIDLAGNELAQTIVGNSGDNVLSDGGGAGADILNGYFGNDTYIVRNAATTITEVAGRGTNDRVAAGVDFALAADDDIELLTTTSTAGTAGIDLVGNALAQTIIGNAGSNILRSGTGAPDILRGLGGNDVYRVFNSGDTIIETAGQGSDDRVITTVTYNLATGVDVERLQTDATGGTSNINLIGNELGQTVIGNAGENYIRGQKGSDVLYGLLGDDQFAYFASDFTGGASDIIKDFHEATGDTDVLRLQGSATDYAFANVGANLQVTHNASGGTITINNFTVAQLDAAQVSYF